MSRWGQAHFPSSVGYGQQSGVTKNIEPNPSEPQPREERGIVAKIIDTHSILPVSNMVKLKFQHAEELLVEFVKMQIPRTCPPRF